MLGLLTGCQSNHTLPVAPENIYQDEHTACLFLQDQYGYITAWDTESHEAKWVSGMSLEGGPIAILSDKNRILSLFSQEYLLLSAEDGRRLANGPVSLSADLQPLWVGDQLFGLSSSNIFIAVNLLKGDFTWMRKAPEGVSGFWASWDTSVFFIPGTGHRAYRLDPATGADQDSILLTPPQDSPGLYILPGLCRTSGKYTAIFVDQEVIGISLSPFHVLWRDTLPERPNATALLGTDELLVSLPQSGDLISLSMLSGKQHLQIKEASTTEEAGILTASGWIWVVHEKEVRGFSALNAEVVERHELPMHVMYGPLRVGKQVGVVLMDKTWIAWECPPLP